MFEKPGRLFMGQEASGVRLRSSHLAVRVQPYPGSRVSPSAHHMLPRQCQDERGGVLLSGTGCQALGGGYKTNHLTLVQIDNLEQINVSSADLRINTMT